VCALRYTPPARPFDLLRDVGYSVSRRRAERYTLAEYLRP
jgi:hypothetical protein